VAVEASVVVRALEEIKIEAEASVMGINLEVTSSQDLMDQTGMASATSSQRKNKGAKVSAMVRSLLIWMRLILP